MRTLIRRGRGRRRVAIEIHSEEWLRPICNSINLTLVILSLSLIVLISVISAGVAQGQVQGSRQIVLDEFTRARPVKSTKTSSSATSSSRTRQRPLAATNSSKRPTYRRASGTPPVASTSSIRLGAREELGITVWRLRPSRQTDSPARLLVMESSQSSQWTPERIEVDTPLRVSDRVRISVESPRSGYLYVVDREQYADGSLGDAYLIFPTTRTRSAENKLRPGKLIDIPAQEDNPSYFTLVPSSNRSDQVAEVLSFIVTPQPLENLAITDKPLKVSQSDIAMWEKAWSSEVERFEMEGGAGKAWSSEEKEASATSSGRLLTQEEPAPQTVYRIKSRSKNAVLVTVTLRYRT